MSSKGPLVAKEGQKADAQTLPSGGEDQQKPEKLNSASSDLSDLTSDGNTSLLTLPTQSEEAEQAVDSMDEDDSDIGSSEDSEDNDGTPRHSGKGPSRDKRIRFRDSLNKKLEAMFVKAKIELTPYGRIPWTRLGETLASSGCYITGFPEEFAPRVTNDQLAAGTAPSTWSLHRTKPILNLIDDGTIRVLPRPPGRRVLFELTQPDGTKYDSTIGYSNRWLHANMPSEFPSAKRSRSELTPGSPKSSRSPSRNEDASEWSSGSRSEHDDGSHAWKPHRKRQRLSDTRSPSRARPLRPTRRDSAQPALRSRSERAKPEKEQIKQGEKWKEGGIVKKVGRGWIVIEESTEEDDEEAEGANAQEEKDEKKKEAKESSKEAAKDQTPKGQSKKPSNDRPKEKQTKERPEPSTSRQTASPPKPDTSAKKRKHSPLPETPPRPAKRMHPETSPPAETDSPTTVADEKTLKMVVTRIAKLIRDAGYNGSKKIPWSTLPSFLAQRKLYVTGFPYSCLPRIVNDEVKRLSSPPHWKPMQCAEMAESFHRNLVKILPRPAGRKVLFEAIGVDGKIFDSTLGFSTTWIESNMKEPVQATGKKTATSSSKKAHAKQPTPTKQPSASKQTAPAKHSDSTRSPRPSLKLVIPDTGTRLDGKSEPREKVAKPPATKRTEDPKAEKPERSQVQEKQVSPVPRASIPTPIILLQPPTPLGGQGSPIVPAKLQLEDSPMVESPTAGRPPVASNDQQSPHSLSPPALPLPVDPVARPNASSNQEKASSSSTSQKQAKFTFTIPPAKKPKRGLNSLESLSSDKMSIDGSSKGYNLDLMFESPSIENPLGGLPGHLQSKVSEDLSNASGKAKSDPFMGLPPPTRIFRPGEEVIATIQLSPNVAVDSKNGIEKIVRPALVKLFDTAGLSSPGTPLPWVTLPLMLCQRRLFISGFPRHCLPKVVRDKVDGNSGPKSWSHPALTAMLNALKAGEVKIKHRPRGRKVLFHLLPSDTQREEGNKHGTDSTLAFSQTWVDEHMIDDPNELPDEEMQFEPSELPIIPRPLPPRRESSVWERFGKIRIEESDSEDEDRVPEPPWKTAMREFTRPQYDDASDNEGKAASIPVQSSDEEEEVELSINHLLPPRIPHMLQGKGRVILNRDDQFEWVPNNPYATDCPPERVVWCPSKSKWKLMGQMRDMDRWARGFVPVDIPNRVGGKILGKGVCEHNAIRKVWECSFVGRKVFGDLRWSPDICSWEWFLQDADGRRKWLTRLTPDREYESSREGTLSPMSI